MALKFTNPQFARLTATVERKTYTVVGVTLLVVILLVFFAIRPAVGSIFERLNENEEKRDILGKMDAKYDTLLSLSNQEQQREDQLALLENSYPSNKQEEFPIANTIEMINRNGLRFTSIGVNDATTKSALDATKLGTNTKFFVINISVEGERANFIKFVKELEDFPRIFNIQKIAMTPLDNSQGSTNREIKGEIEAEIYYYTQ